MTKSLEVLLLSTMIPLIGTDKAIYCLESFNAGHLKLDYGKVLDLQKTQRYQLLKIIFASTIFSLEAKLGLLGKEKSTNFSDFDTLEELGCFACLPSDEDKQRTWDRYISGKDLNVKQIEASAKHFYNTENAKQCEHFADLFFTQVEQVFATHSRDYAAMFFANLCPTFLGREGDLERY